MVLQFMRVRACACACKRVFVCLSPRTLFTWVWHAVLLLIYTMSVLCCTDSLGDSFLFFWFLRIGSRAGAALLIWLERLNMCFGPFLTWYRKLVA